MLRVNLRNREIPKGQKPTRRWSLLKICEVDVIHDLDAHRIES
jgi:hypothetical protein